MEQWQRKKRKDEAQENASRYLGLERFNLAGAVVGDVKAL
jgi:hypothetical protein